MENSAYISGDYISHLHVKGREKPWLSEFERSLIWNNIYKLSQNFLENKIDVVVDYVAFPSDAKWLAEQLQQLNVRFIYVVLWTDKQTLIYRDSLRLPEHQMGKRCLILMDEYTQADIGEQHVLNTSLRSTDELIDIVNDIKNNNRFVL